MLKLYDSTTNKLRPFVPIDDQRVTAYKCGPTVYSTPHIGNLRSAVVFDVLHRVLKRLYPSVVWAENLTDIDDKIMSAAKARSVPILTVTTEATQSYNEALRVLHVLDPTIQPRVTDNMDDIIGFIENLIEGGHAYESEQHVLFDRTANPDFYLNLNLRPEDLNSEGSASYKKHPHDFVLWKPSTDDQPGWESPWGRGRPGWHIECSAMIAAHLGTTIDIHVGGVDLKFPHHENECAQSHARFGQPLANYWLHNGMLQMGGKMSKSAGNVVVLGDLTPTYTPEAIRYFLLSGHYRQPLKYTVKKLVAADVAFKSLQRTMKMVGPMMVNYTYLEPLLDDLNTPRALSELHILSTAIQAHRASDDDIARFISLSDAMGLLHIDEYVSDEVALLLLKQRVEARAKRDFVEADRIREVILSLGYEVNDKPL